jgi:hypothetical protein
MSHRARREPYLTPEQVGRRLGLPAPLVLRRFRAGLIPGRRLRDGSVGFRWSEVVDAWDGHRQLSFEDDLT